MSERRNGKGVEEAKNRGREGAETEKSRERRVKGGEQGEGKRGEIEVEKAIEGGGKTRRKGG